MEKLDAGDVIRIAGKVARKELGAENVIRVDATPTVDWTGAEAWRVKIVLEPDALSRISGDAALDNLYRLFKSVQEAGDDRFTYVEFTNEKELAAGDDTEC